VGDFGQPEMQPTKIHGIRGMPNELGNIATEPTKKESGYLERLQRKRGVAI